MHHKAGCQPQAAQPRVAQAPVVQVAQASSGAPAGASVVAAAPTAATTERQTVIFRWHVPLAGGKGVRKPHLKGQTPLQFDLPIKQVNGFRGGQPQLGKNGFHLKLEAWFDTGANRRGLIHGSIVALLWLHCNLTFAYKCGRVELTQSSHSQ